MKVSIKIKPDAIIALHRSVQKIYDMPPPVKREERVYRSIGLDLADVFEKKFKSVIKNQTLFDNKAQKITIKFHEAVALLHILPHFLQEAPNPFIKAQLQNVINELDQKTC